MTQPKRSIKASRKMHPARKAKLKGHHKPTNAAAPNPDCPHRPGTLYTSLFAEGNQDYILKGELIKKVAEMTKNPRKWLGLPSRF
jgi:hypothetical protein